MLKILLLLGFISYANSDNPAIKIVENSTGFTVTEGQNKVLFYQRTPKSKEGEKTRSHYIHPLYGLDGEILTEDFPEDHLHHRGVFWAWHQVWIADKRIGDGWSLDDFSWDVKAVEIVNPDSESSALKILVYWKSPLWSDEQGKQKPFVEENSVIRIYRAAKNFRKIDFEIGLLALEEKLTIGGSEDNKGYGGFSARIRMPQDFQLISKNGAVKPIRYQITAGPWLDFAATFKEKAKKSGLAILCHPSLPNFPQPWIVRQKRSMQNPVWPGREPVPLSTQEQLILRYRMIIHRGDANDIDLDECFKEYAAQATFILGEE